jgi:hypothetical protein
MKRYVLRVSVVPISVLIGGCLSYLAPKAIAAADSDIKSNLDIKNIRGSILYIKFGVSNLTQLRQLLVDASPSFDGFYGALQGFADRMKKDKEKNVMILRLRKLKTS